MFWFILFLAIVYFGISWIRKVAKNSNSNDTTTTYQSYDQNTYNGYSSENTDISHLAGKTDYYIQNGYYIYTKDDQKSINTLLLPRKGYSHYDLVGIKYRNLDTRDYNEFEGYALAETDNQYDQFAVSIWRCDGRHLGYVPKGDRDLWTFISNYGGKVKAYGIIYLTSRGKEVGVVNVEFDDASTWSTPEEDRYFKSPNIKLCRLYAEYPSRFLAGKFFGYAKLGDKFNIDIYDENNNKLGVVLHEEYIYNTAKKFNDEEFLVWGYNKGGWFEYPYVYIPLKCGEKKINSEIDFFKEVDLINL